MLTGEEDTTTLRHRPTGEAKEGSHDMTHAAVAHEAEADVTVAPARVIVDDDDEFEERGCCSRTVRAAQNGCYQFLAATFWDCTVAGFRPGRVRAMELLDIHDTDRVLLVGEGSGLDFDCLPADTDLTRVFAFDFSTQMVRQAKQKARRMSIPEDNVFVGDAQHLPYTTERFNKIYFPLSLGSIPNPRLALQEAERVLAPGGRIVLFEKIVDDGAVISRGRACLNFFTQCIFANINRRLTDMMGAESPLKITGYESLRGRLDGCLAGTAAPYYRLATLVRTADFPDTPAMRATLG